MDIHLFVSEKLFHKTYLNCLLTFTPHTHTRVLLMFFGMHTFENAYSYTCVHKHTTKKFKITVVYILMHSNQPIFICQHF